MATTFSNVAGIKGMNAPNIVIQDLAASPYGFASVNTSWVWGTVVAVYAGCLNWGLGDVVFYDKTQARRFKYGSINYFSVDEQYVFWAETPVL